MAPDIVMTQVASAVGVIAGAWMFKSLIQAEQQKTMVGGLPRCPTCNGSRRVPCMCQRWSDGDSGCRTCQGTGMMRCSSCGGTGTGKPIPVQLRVSRANGRNSDV